FPFESGHVLALDGSGNIYLTFPTFDSSRVVAKYDPSGALQWTTRVDGLGAFIEAAIAVDSSGNSYVTGSFGYTAIFGPGEANQTTLIAPGNNCCPDMFIAKYDASGALQWAKQAGGIANDVGEAIAFDGSGNSYVTGYFQATATFGSGEPNQTT